MFEKEIADEYELTINGEYIIKNGHTMFQQDVLKELKYLQAKLKELQSHQSTGDDAGLSKDMKHLEGIYKDGAICKPETLGDTIPNKSSQEVNRKAQINRIIQEVQMIYPENSAEALSYAINLTIISENDYWVNRIREGRIIDEDTDKGIFDAGYKAGYNKAITNFAEKIKIFYGKWIHITHNEFNLGVDKLVSEETK